MNWLGFLQQNNSWVCCWNSDVSQAISLAANTAGLWSGVSMHTAWIKKVQVAGSAMQMFTMNNVKETRTLGIPLLFLKCRNPFLTGMRKPKHGSVCCCTLCIKHETPPSWSSFIFLAQVVPFLLKNVTKAHKVTLSKGEETVFILAWGAKMRKPFPSDDIALGSVIFLPITLTTCCTLYMPTV